MNMNAQNLVQAIEQADSESHFREFEVGGQMLTFPRLSSWDQGQFEREVRKDNPTFSIGGTRNKITLAMANMQVSAKREIEELRKKAGDKPVASTPEEAREIAVALQEGIMKRFEPFADRIFSGFTRDKMALAIAMSLVAEYGADITYTKEIEGEKVPVACKIDSEFVDRLFAGESGNSFETVFSYVTGLAEKPKQTEAQLAAGMSVDDVAKETVGDEKNSEREQDSE